MPGLTEEAVAADEANLAALAGLVEKYEAAMDDDLNTADAIAAIFEMVKLANTTVKDGSKTYAAKLLSTIEELCGVLGIITEKEEEIGSEDLRELERVVMLKEGKIIEDRVGGMFQ